MPTGKCLVFILIAASQIGCTAVSGLAPPTGTKQVPCKAEDVDTAILPACVIQSSDDGLYVAKKYWTHANFNRYGLAPFTIISFGRVYINRAGRIVIRDVAYMDNGPDDFHHGLVRIERKGIWGYADPTGRIVVPMKYSCALNYRDGYQDVGPLVCVGCRIEQQGEYHACLGGKWFRVDSHYHLVPKEAP